MDYKRLLREEREKARRDYEDIKANGKDNHMSIELLDDIDKKADTAVVPVSLKYSRFQFCPFLLEEFRIGSLPNIYYIPEIVNSDDEMNLIDCIRSCGTSRRNIWKQLKTRRLQCWGKKLTSNPDEMSDNDSQILPDFLQMIADNLVESFIFDDHNRPGLYVSFILHEVCY